MYLRQKFPQKKKFHSSSSLPSPLIHLECFFFEGGCGCLVLTGTRFHVRSDRHGGSTVSSPPSFLPSTFQDVAQVPEDGGTIYKAQRGSCMCSRHPAVKLQGIIVGCPQVKCQCQRTKDGKKDAGSLDW